MQVIYITVYNGVLESVEVKKGRRGKDKVIVNTINRNTYGERKRIERMEERGEGVYY